MSSIQKRSESIAAYPVQPSRQFYGNDGRWSTFLVDIGSPAQQFSTLISTSSWATWLVKSDACSTSRDPTVAQHSDCYNLRGSTRNKGWQSADSKTYKAIGGYNLELNNDLPLGTVFGSSPVGYNYTGAVYNSNATVGRDSVTLLPNSDKASAIPANNSLVYGVLDQSFWVSMVGIGYGTLQFDQDKGQFGSLLDLYANQSSIPSKSWGYTAGKYYDNSFGSLTLGGYDSSRIEAPVHDFKMDSFRDGKGTSQLMVSVQSISVQDSSSGITSITKSNDTTTTFNAVIDSSLPYLYLPRQICDKFATLLGLRYDNKTDLYFPGNATQRSKNSGTKINILVSDTNQGIKTSKEIILPYAAFDLNMSWPIFDDPVPYFPIRRSVGDKAILGRTFLQEAFVIADYGRGNFTVGRAIAGASNVQNIVTISSASNSQSSSDASLSKGAIAGIVVGSFFAVASVALGIWYFFFRRRRSKSKKVAQTATAAVDEKVRLKELNDAEQGDEERPGHSRHMSELSGSSTLVGKRKSSAPAGNAATVYEADAGVPIHEMEDKSDTEAWMRAQRAISASAEPAERYELDGA